MFTVGITNHNYARYLPHAIESALEQGAEVIVVDDASTDASRDIISRYPVTSILHDEASGSCVRGCQEIIEAVTDGWLIMLDADDYLLPGAVKTYRKFTDDADWLVCNLGVVNDADQIYAQWDYTGWPFTPEDALAWAKERLMMPVSMKGAFRVGWLKDNDLSWYAWGTNKFADDCRTCLEYLEHDPRIRHVPYLLYAYRQHEGQGSKDTAERERFTRDIKEYFKEGSR